MWSSFLHVLLEVDLKFFGFFFFFYSKSLSCCPRYHLWSRPLYCGHLRYQLYRNWFHPAIGSGLGLSLMVSWYAHLFTHWLPCGFTYKEIIFQTHLLQARKQEQRRSSVFCKPGSGKVGARSGFSEFTTQYFSSLAVATRLLSSL